MWAESDAYAWNQDPLRPPTTAQEHANRYYRQNQYGESFSHQNYFPHSRSVSPDRVSNCSSNNSETRATSNNPETRRGYEWTSNSQEPRSLHQETEFRNQEAPFRGNGPQPVPSWARTGPVPRNYESTPRRSEPVPRRSEPAPRRNEPAPLRNEQPSDRREQTRQESYDIHVDFHLEWGPHEFFGVPPRRSSIDRDAEPGLVKGVTGYVDLCVLTLKRRWIIFPPRNSFEVTVERPGQKTTKFIMPNTVVQNIGTYDYWYENETLGNGLEIGTTRDDTTVFCLKYWTGCECTILINGRTGNGDINYYRRG